MRVVSGAGAREGASRAALARRGKEIHVASRRVARGSARVDFRLIIRAAEEALDSLGGPESPNPENEDRPVLACRPGVSILLPVRSRFQSLRVVLQPPCHARARRACRLGLTSLPRVPRARCPTLVRGARCFRPAADDSRSVTDAIGSPAVLGMRRIRDSGGAQHVRAWMCHG